MTKFFALVVCLSTFMLASVAHANDGLLGNILKTKQIVRMKLWYEGVDQTQLNSEQNQDVKQIEIKEELDRALNKVDF